jgi:hypothetical protein
MYGLHNTTQPAVKPVTVLRAPNLKLSVNYVPPLRNIRKRKLTVQQRALIGVAHLPTSNLSASQMAELLHISLPTLSRYLKRSRPTVVHLSTV